MTSRGAELAAVLDSLEDERGACVARGRRALMTALGWTGRTRWPEVAWSFSDLADGLPVELVWRPGERGFAWTAEPAAPEWPAKRGVARALALAGRMGCPLPPEARIDALALAASHEAPFVAWIAGRHGEAADRAKLYLRVSADAVASQRIGVALDGRDQPMMLGFSSEGGREFYWRRSARQAGDRYRLGRAGLGALAERLDAALADWSGSGIDAERGGRLGLSVRWAADGHPDALAAFLRVGPAGGADRVRDRLRRREGGACAFGRLWEAGRLRPMLLTLAATEHEVRPVLGFTLPASRRRR